MCPNWLLGPVCQDQPHSQPWVATNAIRHSTEAVRSKPSNPKAHLIYVFDRGKPICAHHRAVQFHRYRLPSNSERQRVLYPTEWFEDEHLFHAKGDQGRPKGCLGSVWSIWSRTKAQRVVLHVPVDLWLWQHCDTLSKGLFEREPDLVSAYMAFKTHRIQQTFKLTSFCFSSRITSAPSAFADCGGAFSAAWAFFYFCFGAA